MKCMILKPVSELRPQLDEEGEFVAWECKFKCD